MWSETYLREGEFGAAFSPAGGRRVLRLSLPLFRPLSPLARFTALVCLPSLAPASLHSQSQSVCQHSSERADGLKASELTNRKNC